jgi:hypothetical protein
LHIIELLGIYSPTSPIMLNVLAEFILINVLVLKAKCMKLEMKNNVALCDSIIVAQLSRPVNRVHY